MLDMRIPPLPTTPKASGCPAGDGETPQERRRREESMGGEGNDKGSGKSSEASGEASSVGEEEGGTEEPVEELGKVSSVCLGPPNISFTSVS